ncbi:MAG: hypothetical protein HY815_27845 [Candidatus Riflebacteria bacterium]|nr:hypothetical protein [Candidatus Riflebacteria bacterium]
MTAGSFVVAFALLAVSSAAVLATGLVLQRRICLAAGWDDALVLITVLCLAEATVLCMVVSLWSGLTSWAVSAGSLLVFVVVVGLTRRQPAEQERPENALQVPAPSDRPDDESAGSEPLPWSRPLAVVAVVLSALSALVGLRTPPLELDTLAYHLPTVVTWIENASLWATVYPGVEDLINWSFTSYYPGNGEIPCLWLMLPFRSDLLVNLVNLPFVAMSSVALRALLCRLSVRPSVANLLAWSLFFLPYNFDRLLNTGYIEPCWLFLLLAAMRYLAGLLVSEPGASSRVGLGLSLGLLLGAKSSAIFFVAVLLAAGIGRLRRERGAFIVAAGLGLLGVPWYLKTYLMTGNPIFPLRVTVGSHVVLPGYWDAAPSTVLAAFKSSKVWLTQLDSYWRALGLTGVIVLVGLLAGPLALSLPPVRRKLSLDRVGGLFLLFPWVFAILFLATPLGALYGYFTFRHALPAVAACLVSVGLVLDRWAAARPTGEVVAQAGIVHCIAAHSSGGHLALLEFVGLIALAWVAFKVWEKAGTARLVVGVVLIACPVVWKLVKYRERTRYDVYLAAYHKGYIHKAARWLETEAADGAVACAGFPDSYFLAGQYLHRKVLYVNINAGRDWLYHQYPNGDYRREPDYACWLGNLRASGVRYLVTAYYGLSGFPIEHHWASTHPADFEPILVEDRCRLFRLRVGPGARSDPLGSSGP